MSAVRTGRRPVRPGISSLKGLDWLARVGPCPVDAWAVAMAWSRAVAYSHAGRLERSGLVQRVPTSPSELPLLVATKRGVSIANVDAIAARPPAPTWWAHAYGCAWTAAWLTGRRRTIQGTQEVAADDTWVGEVTWRQSGERRRANHRPDLAWLVKGRRVAIEVELARKSSPRLQGILALHSRWYASRHTAGVIYVCADERGRERIVEVAAGEGLRPGRGGGLRVELLTTVKEQAHAARVAAELPGGTA